MAKTKAAGPKPKADAAELKRLQARHKALSVKKAFVGKKSPFLDAFKEDLKAETSELGCLLRLRLLLDKQKEFAQADKPAQEKASQEQHKVQEQYKATLISTVNDAVAFFKEPQSEAALSITLAAACFEAYALLNGAGALAGSDEQQTGVAESCLVIGPACLAKAGFSSDAASPGFHLATAAAAFHDPKQEVIRADDIAAGLSSSHLAVTLLDSVAASCAMAGIRLVRSKPDPARKEWVQLLLRSDWHKQLKEAAKELASKQPAAAKQAEQQQQQKADVRSQMESHLRKESGRSAGREQERGKDAKRGKPAAAKPNEEHANTKKLQEALQSEADKVVGYLEQQLQGQRGDDFVSALQSAAQMSVDDLLKPLASQPAAGSGPTSAHTSLVCQDARLQLQAASGASASDKPDVFKPKLKAQLQQLAEGGSWTIYQDEEPGSSKHVLCASVAEYERDVVIKQLAGSEQVDRLFEVQAARPSLLDAYALNSEVADLLDDGAAQQLARGDGRGAEPGWEAANPWVAAFSEECPLQTFKRAAANVISEPTLHEDDDTSRAQAAMGFALLQWQRGTVTCDPVQLAAQPSWAVLCFHLLHMVGPYAASIVLLSNNHPASSDDILIYSTVSQATEPLAALIARPDQQPEQDAGGIKPTDGLQQDNVLMLQMLQDAGVLSGPLLLALQLFLVQHTGAAAQLGKRAGKAGAALDKAWSERLARLEMTQQAELRMFLLWALYNSVARQPAYRAYLEHYLQDFARPAQLPVAAELKPSGKKAPAGKEKDKKDDDVQLLLSRSYYERACLSAAQPLDKHNACCVKHVNLRKQSEADGQSFSRFDPALPAEDFACNGGQVPASQELVDRYLLRQTKLPQDLDAQGITLDSKAGLQALVQDLYRLHNMTDHQHLSTVASPITAQHHWDRTRFELMCSANLACHRRQLYALLQDDEELAKQSEDEDQLQANTVRDRVRALLVHRAAGESWMLSQVEIAFKAEVARLQAEQTQLEGELQAADQPQSDKAAGSKAGTTKESAKEKAEANRAKLAEVQNHLMKFNQNLVMLKTMQSRAANEANSYPDLIRAHYGSGEAAKIDPLTQALTLVLNELLAPQQPGCGELLEQLRGALALCRQKLFQIDVWTVQYSLRAQLRVLLHMEAARRPLAAVLLSKEALKQKLNEGIRKSAEDDLLRSEAERPSSQQPKAASKGKKKKKGPAAQPKKQRRSSADGEGSEDEGPGDAGAAAAAEADEEEEDAEQQDDDARRLDLENLIDMGKMAPEFVPEQKQKQQQQQQFSQEQAAARAAQEDAGGWQSGRGGGSSSSKPAAAPAGAAGERAAVAAAAAPRAGGGGGSRAAAAAAAAAARPGKATAGGKGKGGAAGQLPAKPIYRYNPKRGKVCATCGFVGHLDKECSMVCCSNCNRFGHSSSQCGSGKLCRCGRPGADHASKSDCERPCSGCHRFGHAQRMCPETKCRSCHNLGHERIDCAHAIPPVCGTCFLCHVIGQDCPGKPMLGPEAEKSKSSSSSSAAATGGSGSGGGSAASSKRAPPAAAGAAAGGLTNPANLKLQAPVPEAQLGGACGVLYSRLEAAGLADYATKLVETPDKMALLLRVPDEDMAQYLKQHSAAARRLLDEVWEHNLTTTVGSQGVSKAEQRRQQQQQQQQQQRRGAADGAGARSGSAGRPDSSGGGGAGPHAAATDAVPARAERDAGAAPQAGHASVSFKAVAQQQPQPQQQPQQQQPGPFQLSPPPPQQPLFMPPMTPEQRAEIIDEDLAPWMLLYTEGTTRLLEQYVKDDPLMKQLRELDPPAPRDAVLVLLQLRATLQSLADAGRDVDFETARGYIEAALAQAPQHYHHQQQQQLAAGYPGSQYQQQFAVPGGLPPHLQHVQRGPAGLEQQQQQQLLLHPHAPQFAGMPVAAVPPAAAADEDSDGDSEDALLGLLTGTGSGAQPPPQQQQQLYQPSERDFPGLGADSSSGAVRGGPAVNAAGLANETGEYNCFLNVVVQCLWSCPEFRAQAAQIPPYQAERHPVVVALLQLFGQMQHAESSWQPGHDRIVVNPTELREALDARTSFRRQEMNDAPELLVTLHECFRECQDSNDGAGRCPGSNGVFIDGQFGLLVSESLVCKSCGVETHIIAKHWEHTVVVNTMAMAIAAMELQHWEREQMGIVLRQLYEQDWKYCDKDVGGCGIGGAPRRTLHASPQVLTMQMVWDQVVTADDIGAALSFVRERVDIKHMYADAEIDDTVFTLASIVAYYGQHYMAFVYNQRLGTWLLFDDASISSVGSWQDVVSKCSRGRIQPSVLLYTLTGGSGSSSSQAAAAAAAAGAPPPLPSWAAAAYGQQPQQQAAPAAQQVLHHQHQPGALQPAMMPQPAPQPQPALQPQPAPGGAVGGGRPWEQQPGGSGGNPWGSPARPAPPPAAAADGPALPSAMTAGAAGAAPSPARGLGGPGSALYQKTLQSVVGPGGGAGGRAGGDRPSGPRTTGPGAGRGGSAERGRGRGR